MNQETKNIKGSQIRITTVRYDEKRGRELLQNWIFGGILTSPRVPRGIDPQQVSRFIEEELKPDSPSIAYAKTVRVLRFYEGGDCLPYLRRVLTGRERTLDDICRSAYVLQGVGDLGNRKEADEVAQYFDAHLVAHPKALEAVDVLLETLVVLSPSGNFDHLSKRIADEVDARKAAENQSVESMRAYAKAADIQGLRLPEALARASVKRRLLAMEPVQRLPELISIYMGTSSVSDDLMMTWAARMLRRFAMEIDPSPVYEAFATEIAKADPGKVGKDDMTDTIVSRAAQAILYLQGKLTKNQRELYEKTKLGAMNFLWDDFGQ